MPSKSIKAIVQDINNRDADGGGLWLPNIQREFVWEEEQIERLFDSIMRQYPLSSMLIWKTRDEIKHRSFIQNYNNGKVSLKSHYQNDHARLKRLILDGQQRLQSLYLGLRGSIDGRVLHFDLLSGDAHPTEDMRYRFSFRDTKNSSWPWVPLADLVFTNELPSQIVPVLLKKHSVTLSSDDKDRASVNVERLWREFNNEGSMLYQELDNTYDDNGLTFEDVVEVFIRANSGGTKLSKSDLMFTLLTTEWTEADVEFEDFLEDINDNGRFQFERDFLIKLSTALLGYGAKYDVEKLRDEKVRQSISENWGNIAEALRFVKDEVVRKTYIRSGKAMVSYNALIPLVYAYFHYPEKWKRETFLSKYLLRSLLGGAFSGQPDGLIDRLINTIKKDEEFNLSHVFTVIHDYGKNLNIGEDKLLYRCGYGSGNIHLLFNLWYGPEYKASSMKNEPQVDHIFARSILKKQKVQSEESGRMVQRYYKWEIDQLANCMLLPAHENGAGDKSDKPLHLWLQDKNKEFLVLHCIPLNKSLWVPERYNEFIKSRQALILKKFQGMDLLDKEKEYQ
ncbi:DUF262 domain-containing protein [uncultured Porticoccus sp.]|mgnify:CR=1 FL=1|uniref:DUF262 domain-containing protein n=1 Tax=uncultured Porticoccus sp. TaxID=1256050 RepID=UPI0030DA8A51|tara:strand:- start:11487 stop:13178 length:1692 start_codon:yes stop_codon:yes gene_type:complete